MTFLKPTVIHIFDANTGKAFGDGKPLKHKWEILQLGLDQCGSPLNRRVAVLDKNMDLYLIPIRQHGSSRKVLKLGSMIYSFMWSSAANLLAAMTSETLSIWLYPNIAHIEREMLALVKQDYDNHKENGKTPSLVKFMGNRVTLSRCDGSLVYVPISPYPTRLHQLLAASKWNEALKLCRSVEDRTLWACLAGAATFSKELDVAVAAYGKIEEMDKVEYINYVKGLATKEMRDAEMMLLIGERQDAECMLLQAGLYFRAVMINVNLHHWERALELALQYKVGVAVVTSARHNYLEAIKAAETMKSFISQPDSALMNQKTLFKVIDEEYKAEDDRAKQSHGKECNPPTARMQQIAGK